MGMLSTPSVFCCYDAPFGQSESCLLVANPAWDVNDGLDTPQSLSPIT